MIEKIGTGFVLFFLVSKLLMGDPVLETLAHSGMLWFFVMMVGAMWTGSQRGYRDMGED